VKHLSPRELDELPRLFRFLDEAARTLHLHADAKFALDLAVEELFTNALKHNPDGRGPIGIEVWTEPGENGGPCLRVTFTDPDAPPFDPASIPPVDTLAPLHERKPGGLGLHILANIMESVTSEHDGRTSRIHLLKSLSPRPDHV
jgi:serine/threonine-protein kinase RsbW